MRPSTSLIRVRPDRKVNLHKNAGWHHATRSTGVTCRYTVQQPYQYRQRSCGRTLFGFFNGVWDRTSERKGLAHRLDHARVFTNSAFFLGKTNFGCLPFTWGYTTFRRVLKGAFPTGSVEVIPAAFINALPGRILRRVGRGCLVIDEYCPNVSKVRVMRDFREGQNRF